MRSIFWFFVTVLVMGANVARAQDDAPRIGTVAGSSSGQAGQRQTPGQQPANINAMGRIDSRIANRVQSRMRNRIDRNYDPTANASSPFKVAAEQARTKRQN
jgi:hypothetical protein